MSHSDHDHHLDSKPLGIVDILSGAIIFLGLWKLASTLAGPEGVGFLKNLLNEQRSFEMLFSGLLFLVVWLVLGKLVIVPFLEAFYQREEQTSGTLSSNQELKKEISNLKSELERELNLARVAGVAKKNERLSEAKKRSDEILEAEKGLIGEELARLKSELSSQREELMISLDKEVDTLSTGFYQRLTSVGSQTIH